MADALRVLDRDPRSDDARPCVDFWAQPMPRVACAVAWLVQYGILLSLYLWVNSVTSPRSVATPLLAFESRIPLVPAAFLVYASVYLEGMLPVVLLRTPREYLKLQVACTVATFIGFAVFFLMPMSYPRPAMEAHGAAQALLAIEWAVDRPGCTFPSLHVAFAWLLAFSLGARSRTSRAVWFTSALLISVATLLVKQHYVVDVIGGVVLALGCWRVAPAASAWCERLFDRRLGAPEPPPSSPSLFSAPG